ncbi:MAG: SDR family oxidoreductase [Actinomycetota bacterium]
MTRIALITGSSRGVGAATARRLAAADHDVVVTYRTDRAAAATVADDVCRLGRRAWVRALDLEDESAIQETFEWMASDIGQLDVLVANAARTTFRPLVDCRRYHLERTFATSVFGFHSMVMGALPLLAADRGQIVVVSGCDVDTWIPGHGGLAAAKAALDTMVKYLACELGELGVSIVGVNPGWVSTDSLKLMLGGQFDDLHRAECATHPRRAAAEPEDVARCIEHLLADRSGWLSGQTIRVDGGGSFSYGGRYMMMAGDRASTDRENAGGRDGVDNDARPELEPIPGGAV